MKFLPLVAVLSISGVASGAPKTPSPSVDTAGLYRMKFDGTELSEIGEVNLPNVRQLAVSKDESKIAIESQVFYDGISGWPYRHVFLYDVGQHVLDHVSVGYEPSFTVNGSLLYNVNSWQSTPMPGTYLYESGTRTQLHASDYPWTHSCRLDKTYLGRCGPAGGDSPSTQICEYALESGAELSTLNVSAEPFLDSTYPRYSEDCKLVMTGDWAKDAAGLSHFWLMARGEKDQMPRQISLEGMDQFRYAVSNSGQFLAFLKPATDTTTSDAIYVRSIKDGSLVKVFQAPAGGQIRGLTLSPDGKYLYFAGQKGYAARTRAAR